MGECSFPPPWPALDVHRTARAKDRLGERFGIADFHDVVLGSGALPLSLLGQVVGRRMAETEAEAW